MADQSKTAPKGKPGRPKKSISADQVESLARIQCTLEEMAAVLRCNKKTLTRNFRKQLDRGREYGRASVRRKQFELMNGADTKVAATMSIWLGKQMLGQTDRAQQEVTGKGGGAIKTEATVKIAIDLEQCGKEFEDFARSRLGDGALQANRN